MSQYEVIDETEVGKHEEEQEQSYHQKNVTGREKEAASEDSEDNYYPKRRHKPKSSEVWKKFTIINRKHYLASCNICGAKLSFKTTISNLKKHIIRKHNYDVSKSCVVTYQPKYKAVPVSSNRLKLTDLGGLDGVILNVVADEGEDPNEEIVESNNIQNEIQEYVVGREGQVNSAKSPSKEPKTNERNERVKRNNLMDMQVECLELKKYSMQMEILMLERQLNLPRSVYTENLRGCDNITRGTQTDVGGGNIKVFYVMDNQGSGRQGSHQLFSFQAREQE